MVESTIEDLQEIDDDNSLNEREKNVERMAIFDIVHRNNAVKLASLLPTD